MFDWVSFEKHEGSWKEKDVIVLALSTCGFCKRGMEFLDKNDIEYRYVHVDELTPEEKKRISEEFKDKFGQRGLYPTIIVDDADYQLGFIEKAWRKTLGFED